MSSAANRDALHQLIDSLRPEDVATAQRVLQALNASSDRDPLLRALTNAPLDDEAETDAERDAAERARQDVQDGKTVSYEDVRRKLPRA